MQEAEVRGGGWPPTLNSASSLTTGQIPAYPSWARHHQVWVLGKGQGAAPLAGDNSSHTNDLSIELLPSEGLNASLQRGAACLKPGLDQPGAQW